MARLEDLQKSLHDMTHDELMEKVRQIRRDRRKPSITKAKSPASKTRKAAGGRAKASPLDEARKVLGNLSDVEIAALLGSLDDEGE